VPQSQALANEIAIMRRIETAFADAKKLPPKAAARILAWARDEYLDGDA